MSESLMEAQRLTRSHVTPSMVNRLNNKDINTKLKDCMKFIQRNAEETEDIEKGGNSRRWHVRNEVVLGSWKGKEQALDQRKHMIADKLKKNHSSKYRQHIIQKKLELD